MYSTAALKWNRKIQCGNSCSKSVFLYIWRGNGIPRLFLSNTPACQQQFFDKSSAQHEIRCFFIDQHSAVSDDFFSTYCTVFLKFRYRDIGRVLYKKLNGWEVGHWLTANFAFPVVTWKNIDWSFSTPFWCNKHLPGQNIIWLNYCFRVFWHV